MKENCNVNSEALKTKPGFEQFMNSTNGQSGGCTAKKKPMWLILLDNVPTLTMFILGTIIISEISVIGAAGYLSYAFFSIVWFWAKICTYCYHYGSKSCPCGYGVVSSKLFKRRFDNSFIKVFKGNLGIVFPNWFVPFGVAMYLLVTQYTQHIFILTLAFSFIGFVVIPVISKYVGCKSCEIKDECPWMMKKVPKAEKQSATTAVPAST